MMNFNEINPKKLTDFNTFSQIGEKWMLITAGDKEKLNTMTASWGMLGILWNKNVAMAFVRPQRYTFEFLEKNDYYTLSFFESEYRKQLNFCGTNSGRDVDKVKKTGLTPVFDSDAPYFKEAKFVFVCKKIYSQFITPEGFVDLSLDKNYEKKDYHKMYVGEIVKCLEEKTD